MAIITLNGIDISNSEWIDRVHSHLVGQSVLQTLSGGRVVFSKQLQTSSRPITLEGDWIKSQVDLVWELSEQAGQSYALRIHTDVFQVIFRHHEPPAFQATPYAWRANAQSDDWFRVTLKLMVI